MKRGTAGLPGRSRPADEWIYGINPVLEAVRAGRRIRAVFFSTSRKERREEIEAAVGTAGVPLNRVDEGFLDSRFGKGHQGVAAQVECREHPDLETFLSVPSKRGELPLFLILDCIQDTRNLGALLRIADAGGVHGVVLQEHRSVSLSPAAVKASAGASEHVPVIVVPNIKHVMRRMKADGCLLVGAEAGHGRDLWDADLNTALAVVIGSEGEGMRKTVREACDVLVTIPMKGMVNSLNASVAAGIVVFEVMRQRRSGNEERISA